MITSPILGLPVLEGSDPVAQIDDWCQQFVAVLEGSVLPPPLSFALRWSGSVNLGGVVFVPTYTSSVDETGGAGSVPVFALNDGITVPSDGIWHVQVVNSLTYPTGAVTSVTTTVAVDGGVKHEVAIPVSPTSGAIRIGAEFSGWLAAGSVVRGAVDASEVGATAIDSTVRLVGAVRL